MKKQTHPTHVVRMSRGLKNKLEECNRVMKSVDKFVQDKAAQIARNERQIRLLMTENNVLRKAIKIRNRKKPSFKLSFPFIFPELTDSPSDVLNRRIEEILPLIDNMDIGMQNARTRAINVFRNCEWQTVGDMLRGDKYVEGPEWEKMLRYRKFGSLSLSILKASFDRFKVDRKNLSAEAPASAV